MCAKECERAISIQRYADDEVCHVLWEHNDLSIADDSSMSDLPITESISIAIFLSLLSSKVVCEVHSLSFVAAIMDRVCAWCRLLRTVTHRQWHANQFTCLAQLHLGLFNLARVGILYASGLRYVSGNVANDALFRCTHFGRLLAFWRRCMHRGSLGHV